MIDIETIMSTDLITVSPEDDLDMARMLMRDNRIHHLLVTGDDGILQGILSLSDLLAATDSFLREEESRLHPRDIKVKEIMVTDLATVDEHAGLRQAALFLEKHRIGCLPVVTDGELRGIITDTDFIGVAINLLEQLESMEPLDSGETF
ncbi:MAG: CBS domain-containing protein [Gammaproteobacteria bacterium]|nr:CBS domain-containing protein [Gammaproteobacteria bacterium]